MRLINVHTKRLEDFIDDSKPTPPYAILSHTWGPDHEELSFQDLQADQEKTGPGRDKFEKCCAQAIRDNLSYAWIDTCCIDKTNSTELSEAINSMFKWYKNARICYSYLSDVDSFEDPFEPQSTFWKSRWFRRGWTLQELIAPQILRFYNSNWGPIGHKRDPQVVAALVQITQIPRMYLLGTIPINEASVAQRMSWAANRVTKRTEDLAYCLLGIFGITMPMVYGEGDRAFLRLQEVIAGHINDDSILAWNFNNDGLSPELPGVKSSGALATSPSNFAYCSHIVPSNPSSHVGGPLSTLGGSLLLRRNVHTDSSGQRLVILQCQLDDAPTTSIGVPVQVRSGGYDKYTRHPEKPAIPIHNTSSAIIEEVRIPIDISHTNNEEKRRNAFYIENTIEKDLELVSVAPYSSWDKTNSMLIPNDQANMGHFHRLWTMFKPHDASASFILILDLFWKGSTPQVEHYLLTCNSGIELQAVRQDLHNVDRSFFSRQEKSAGNGTINIHVKVTRERVGAHDMFVVRLLPSEKSLETYNCTKDLERVQLERNTVDAFQQYHQSEEAFVSANAAIEKKQAELEPITNRLAEVRVEIDMLMREQSRLQQMEKMISLDMARLSTKSDALRSVREAVRGQAEALYHRFQDESPKTDVSERAPQDWTEKAAEEIIQAKEAIGYFKEKRSEMWRKPHQNVTDPTQKFLFAAAMVGYESPFRQLIRQKVDVNMVNPDGISLITIAAYWGSKPIVRTLLALGANTNPKAYIFPPLYAACRNGHFNIVNLLLCHDSRATEDLSWRAPAGPQVVPLTLAARSDHLATVGLLLKFGADVDAPCLEGTALICAATRGYEPIVRLLLDFGANHRITTDDGRTARDLAKRSGHSHVVEMLSKLDTETRDRWPVLSKLRNSLGIKREDSNKVARGKASGSPSSSTG
ncbi:hypothetical protein F4803DRAFT_545377 [Xylaria telfairii]|nr:hypothetical protein F4803DRAFT_545377 [Xylaria telfairii]